MRFELLVFVALLLHLLRTIKSVNPRWQCCANEIGKSPTINVNDVLQEVLASFTPITSSNSHWTSCFLSVADWY